MFVYFTCVYLQFEKPGRREKFDYPDMALEAGILLCFIIELSYNPHDT